MAAQVLGIMRGSVDGEISLPGNERRVQEVRTLIYEVQVDANTDGINKALAALGVPAMGDAYRFEGDVRADLRCRTLQHKQNEDNPTIRYITATFEADPEELAEVEVDFEIVRETMSGVIQLVESQNRPAFAAAGQGELLNTKIKNSAGEPFDPPPEHDVGYMVLRISRNESVNELNSFQRLNNSVNQRPIFGGLARQWKMYLRAAPIPNHRDGMWRVSYELHYRRDTWKLRILDQGHYYLDGGEKKPFKDQEKNIILGNLDGAGGALAAAADPVFLEFVQFREELWPEDLEDTVKRFYSVQGPARGGGRAIPNANVGGGVAGGARRREVLTTPAERRRLGRLGFNI